jgi:hypothetical protein
MSNCPLALIPVVTALGVGGAPGTGSRLDASGCAAPVAQTVRKVGSVAPTAVTLSDTPVAVIGMPVARWHGAAPALPPGEASERTELAEPADPTATAAETLRDGGGRVSEERSRTLAPGTRCNRSSR